MLVIAVAALASAAAASGTQSTDMTSSNWSGYLIDGGPFSIVTATFNVPNLAAASQRTATAEWVGVDGTSPTDHSLIQAGVGEDYDPQKNIVSLYVWWEILPALETLVPIQVHSGDRVSIGIRRVAAGLWQIAIRNLTHGTSFTVTRPYGGQGRTADWIVEAPADASGRISTLGHYVPNVRFTGLRVGGRQGVLHAITMVQGGAVVSQATPYTGSSFTVAYR